MTHKGACIAPKCGVNIFCHSTRRGDIRFISMCQVSRTTKKLDWRLSPSLKSQTIGLISALVHYCSCALLLPCIIVDITCKDFDELYSLPYLSSRTNFRLQLLQKIASVVLSMWPELPHVACSLIPVHTCQNREGPGGVSSPHFLKNQH